MMRHVYLQKRGISPDKQVSWYLRFVLGFICFLVFGWSFQTTILAVLVNWYIHDYGQNLLMKRKLWYLNSTGPIDIFQRETFGEFWWFMIKTVAILTLI